MKHRVLSDVDTGVHMIQHKPRWWPFWCFSLVEFSNFEDARAYVRDKNTQGLSAQKVTR